MVKVLQPTKKEAKVEDLEEEVPARVVQNEISSFNHSSAHEPEDEEYYDTMEEFKEKDSDEEQGEACPPMALKTKDGKEIQLPDYSTRKLEPRRKKQWVTRGIKHKKKMPHVEGKNVFLRYVNAHDCVKDKVTGCYRVEPVEKEKKLRPKPKPPKTKNNKKEKNQNKTGTEDEPEMSKLEQK